MHKSGPDQAQFLIRRENNMVFRLMAFFAIGVLFLALSPIVAFSQDTFGPACGRASIDGRVDPGEWSAASSKTFLMTQGILEATLRVMNSKNCLYLGITINDLGL